MNKTIKALANLALIAMAAHFAGPAHAEDAVYVGLSRATPGDYYADFAGAQRVENYNSPLASVLYGGVGVSEHYAVEIGYGAFGTWKVADPTPGSTLTSRLSSKLTYVAVKGTMPLDDSFTLYAKAGMAANKVKTEASGYLPIRYSFVRPMVGLGAEYNLTEHVAAVVEFDHYGAKGSLKQQKLELGMKFAF